MYLPFNCDINIRVLCRAYNRFTTNKHKNVSQSRTQFLVNSVIEITNQRRQSLGLNQIIRHSVKFFSRQNIWTKIENCSKLHKIQFPEMALIHDQLK